MIGGGASALSSIGYDIEGESKLNQLDMYSPCPAAAQTGHIHLPPCSAGGHVLCSAVRRGRNSGGVPGGLVVQARIKWASFQPGEHY